MSQSTSLQHGDEQPACMGSDSMRKSTLGWKRYAKKKEKEKESAIPVLSCFHRVYDLRETA